jgi:hypothetical protein
MQDALPRTWMFAACVVAALGSEPTWVQHPSPGAHSIPSPQSSATPAAGPADAKVEFENDALGAVRIRMAPHEKKLLTVVASHRQNS